MPNHHHIGILIAKHRKANALSQNALAERTDLDRTYISMLERGLRSPSLETIIKVANAMGIKGSDLLSELEQVYLAPPAINHDMLRVQ